MVASSQEPRLNIAEAQMPASAATRPSAPAWRRHERLMPPPALGWGSARRSSRYRRWLSSFRLPIERRFIASSRLKRRPPVMISER